MATQYGIDLKVVRLLIDISLMCSEREDYERAQTIALALTSFRPDLPHPRTLVGSILLWQGRLREAITNLEETLHEFPNHQLTKAFLGLAFKQIGRRNWSDPLKEVIDDGRDEWAIHLARTVLGYDYGLRAPAAPLAPVVPRRFV